MQHARTLSLPLPLYDALKLAALVCAAFVQDDRNAIVHKLSYRYNVVLGKLEIMKQRVWAEKDLQTAALEGYRKAEQLNFARRQRKKGAKHARHGPSINLSGTANGGGGGGGDVGEAASSDGSDIGHDTDEEGRGDPATQAGRLRAAALADVA